MYSLEAIDVVLVQVIVFYKQNTAYDVRISDWSSDVCSSDLMERFEGLRAMRECLPQVPVVVMSAIEDRDEILRCIEAGAMGYIPKSAQSDEIDSAMQTVLSGGVAFPRRLLEPRSPATKASIYGFGKDRQRVASGKSV